MSQLQVTGEAKIRDIQGPVVANNGVVTALDGAASQYVRGDGTLADFPTSTGGGSSVSYYLNSSVSQGTIGGVAYRELSKNPIIGAGTEIAISANGYIASYITDANDPDLLEVPGGNFNCEFYFSVDSDNHNPYVYAELYKYDGTTFTLLGSNQAIPEYLSSGTTLAPYYFAIPVATATLALTDRIAIRIYVNVDGRTVTLHTEDNHLCQVVTTFSKGMTSLNNLTKQNQYLTVGTSGTDFNIVSSGDTHTFNIPSASASNRGLITTGTQTIAGAKTFTDNTIFSASPLFDQSANYKVGASLVGTGNYIAMAFDKSGTGSGSILSMKLADGTTAKAINLDFLGSPATYTYTFPDATGTLAILEAGTQTFTGTVNILGPLGTKYGISMEKGNTPSPLSLNDIFISAASGATNSLKIQNNSYLSTLNFPTSNQTFTFPALNGTLALLEGTQTFTGDKTFNGGVDFNNALNINNTFNLRNNLVGSTLYTNFSILKSGSLQTLTYLFSTANSSKLVFNDAANYTYTFPTTSGTLALTSNLSSYVPYTGATTNVDLGNYDLTVYNIKVGRGAGGISTNTLLSYGGLQANTTGYHNVAIGTNALLLNTTGYGNTAIGSTSSQSITSGFTNTAIGYQTLGNASTASGNTVVGYNAGLNITTGSNNTIIGAYAATATMSNNVILADGQGTIRYQWNGTTNSFTGSGTFTGALTALTLYSNAGLGLSNSGQFTGGGGYTAINGRTDGIDIRPNNGGIFQFIFSNTTSRTYTLPDASGTLVLGTGTTNYLPKFTGASTLGNSLIFDNGTNVGIGTISPNDYIDGESGMAILQSTNGRAVLSLTGTRTTADEALGRISFTNSNATTAGSKRLAYISGVRGTTNNSAYLEFAVANDAIGSPKMWLSQTGNLGIGTSSPWGKFNVVDGTNKSFVVQDAGIADTIELTNYSNGGGLRNIALTSATLIFNTGTAGGGTATERMRITSGGMVGIGTTGASDVRLFIKSAGNGAGTYNIYSRDSNNVDLLVIRDDGYGYLKANAWAYGSDRRIKENISYIETGLDKILLLKPAKFDYIDGVKNNIGWIAQDVQEVIPEAVNTISEDNDQLTLKSDFIIPYLVKAIQELSAKVTALENK